MVEAMPTVAELDELIDRLVLAATTPTSGCAVTDAPGDSGDADGAMAAGYVDLLDRLETVKSACAAAQARATVALDAAQRSTRARAGVPAKDQGAGIAGQVALARRESPVKGGRLLGLAKALVHEMPHTLTALATGTINEWRATLIVRETATLSVEHRRAVDAELAGHLDGLGDNTVANQTRKIAYRLDPTSAIRRTRGAHTDRRVTVRPAPDTMSYLTGFLPATQGIAVHTALSRHADTLRAGGDLRTRGQIMADTLVERVTGQATAAATPVEIQLVLTDDTLLRGGDAPAHLTGYGPVPAGTVRDLLHPHRAADTADTGAGTGSATGAATADHIADAEVWLRRVYTDPVTGDLTGLDTRRRLFPARLRRALVIRDQVCRTPWCDAPIRHADHVEAHTDGGPTSLHNGQGLCARCNQAKQALGWRSHRRPQPSRHTVTITTPTGHRYTSRAPDLPGREPTATMSRHAASRSEAAFAHDIAEHLRNRRAG